ncbi:EF-hand domain-containing protein [Halomonas kalidii]|uniref:EF-hand domain-containing protein n=1 Tax=Halomonas kalidii TaxID=3043293 RepID=A0ABT6VLB1_9GAMM|nr:EF-hand domain-containing protein [Halomonas kalidii]MDI5934768.1 EF-hand domain-containing protein [Halomonas kalidii]
MKKLILLPLALLFSASVVVAEGTDKFDELDTNQDGSLSQEEASSVEGLDFETADTDGDGSLSEEEFKAAQEGMEGAEGMEGNGG